MPAEIYNPGQVREIFPYLEPNTEWFILGGPADGNEAQVLRAAYPKIEIMGFEPNTIYFDLQLQREFPGKLFRSGLWSSAKRMSLRMPGSTPNDLRSASLVKYVGEAGCGDITLTIPLDDMSARFGPFKNAFLWLDIEGAELEALKGAAYLLASGAINGLNVEVYSEHADLIDGYLAQFGFKEVHRWDEHFQPNDRHWWNAIYKVRSK